MLVTMLLFGGCAPLAKVVFGIDEVKKVDEERIASFLDESREKVSCSQMVATMAQADSLIRLDFDSTQMQHRAQPVQVSISTATHSSSGISTATRKAASSPSTGTTTVPLTTSRHRPL